ncbi:MAG: alpha amylase C-terminal domain-containing protein [Rhodoferax sp.]
MGSELAQVREWNHDAELDWGLLDNPNHAGVKRLVRDLNLVYRAHPALHARDDDTGGFSWIDVQDRARSLFSFVRFGASAGQQMVVICNLTPVVLHSYRLGMPQGGPWREVLNTDLACYGGSGVSNGGTLASDAVACHGHAQSLLLSLPPLGVLWLEPIAVS